MVGAGIALASTPAFADAPTFQAKVSQINDFHPGDSQQYKITVTNGDKNNANPELPNTPITASLDTITPNADFTVAVSGGGGCSGSNSCQFTFGGGAGSTLTITFTISAKATVDVPAGQKVVTEMDFSVKDNATGSVTFNESPNLFGPTPPVVVSGLVVDETTQKPVSGALVNLQDSSGHTYMETTPSSGKFLFTATSDHPIVGSLAIGASKTNYSPVPMTINTGQPTTDLHLLMAPSAVPTPSGPPSTPAQPSAAASAVVGGVTADADPSNLVGAGAPAASSSAFGSIALILGVVLIIGGGAAVAFILYRRKQRDAAAPVVDDDDDDPYTPRRGGGVPDRTRIAQQPGLADAPTMMHRGVVDEYPDPYGAPPRPVQQTYGYEQPAHVQSGAGYGAADYQQSQTAVYRAPAPAPRPPVDPYQANPGYAPATQAYPADQGGYGNYGQQPGYGQPNGYPEQNGYGQGGGYQQPPAHQGYPAQPAPQPGYPDYNQPPQPGYPAHDAGYGGHHDYGTPAQEPGYGYGPGGQGAPGGQGGYGGQPHGNEPGYNNYNGYDQPQPAPAGYDRGQGGYDNGYQQQPGGYGQHQQPHQPGGYGQEQYQGQGGYGQEPYQPAQPDPYRGQPGQPQPHGPGQGYRGGYAPPERGSVDWLDD
jgi:hypothetical protein